MDGLRATPVMREPKTVPIPVPAPCEELALHSSRAFIDDSIGVVGSDKVELSGTGT